jgi:hypothetical protein
VAAKGHERRLEPRVACNSTLKVEYVFPEPEIHDISLSGVCLMDGRTFQRGQILQLRLRFADGETFLVKGIVRRSDPAKGTALEFMEIDHAARRRLRELLSKQGIKVETHDVEF